MHLSTGRFFRKPDSCVIPAFNRIHCLSDYHVCMLQSTISQLPFADSWLPSKDHRSSGRAEVSSHRSSAGILYDSIADLCARNIGPCEEAAFSAEDRSSDGVSNVAGIDPGALSFDSLGALFAAGSRRSDPPAVPSTFIYLEPTYIHTYIDTYIHTYIYSNLSSGLPCSGTVQVYDFDEYIHRGTPPAAEDHE